MQQVKTSVLRAALAFALGAGVFQSAAAAESSRVDPLKPLMLTSDGRLAYIITTRHWAVYPGKDLKTECPKGTNDGPREQFEKQFPTNGAKRTLVDTQLMREGRQWFPSTEREPFEFKEVAGKVSYGMDLDGQVKPTDFVGPDGEKGIDNQLFRAIGCISSYRPPGGHWRTSETQTLRRYNYNRFVIEITGVDSLENDAQVTVKSYRSLDPLMTDASGESFTPGAPQEIDERWGAFAQSTWTGKIVNGVLITDPADLVMPTAMSFGTTANHELRGVRFKLTLTPESAKGFMAGYAGVDDFIRHLNVSSATAIQSYGQLSSPSLYRAMHRLADGYPDPKTGEMTAISSALEVEFTRVFLTRGSATTGENPQLSQVKSGTKK
ncbi:hypothetical protein [Peristeroidobacter soli]|uniref:hypothetical protein n=1 Tax=Peristeroidobacter soli TaxID=2497877 RepID=UPI00101C9B60|nr:hypothetical protein [Peristeroidobacter soli]